MAARKAQMERMIPRPEALVQQESDDSKPSLPPKPGSQPEDSKTGSQSSKPPPSVASFNAEKEKRFQKDQMLQNFERVSRPSHSCTSLLTRNTSNSKSKLTLG